MCIENWNWNGLGHGPVHSPSGSLTNYGLLVLVRVAGSCATWGFSDKAFSSPPNAISKTCNPKGHVVGSTSASLGYCDARHLTMCIYIYMHMVAYKCPTSNASLALYCSCIVSCHMRSLHIEQSYVHHLRMQSGEVSSVITYCQLSRIAHVHSR